MEMTREQRQLRGRALEAARDLVHKAQAMGIRERFTTKGRAPKLGFFFKCAASNIDDWEEQAICFELTIGKRVVLNAGFNAGIAENATLEQPLLLCFSALRGQYAEKCYLDSPEIWNECLEMIRM